MVSEGTGPLAADLSGEVWPEKDEDSQGGGHKGQQAVRDVGMFEASSLSGMFFGTE